MREAHENHNRRASEKPCCSRPRDRQPERRDGGDTICRMRTFSVGSLPLLLILGGCGGGIRPTVCTGACTCSTPNDCMCADGQSCGLSCDVSCHLACGGASTCGCGQASNWSNCGVPSDAFHAGPGSTIDCSGGSSCYGNVGENSTINCTASTCVMTVGANATVACVDGNCALTVGAGSIVNCSGQSDCMVNCSDSAGCALTCNSTATCRCSGNCNLTCAGTPGPIGRGEIGCS